MAKITFVPKVAVEIPPNTVKAHKISWFRSVLTPKLIVKSAISTLATPHLYSFRSLVHTGRKTKLAANINITAVAKSCIWTSPFL